MSGAGVLVVGYGNSLRRDDGVGPLAAEAVACWGLTGVEALAVPQLVPELAEVVAAARLVLFVDAGPGDAVRWEAVTPGASDRSLHHTGDPAWLLGLTRALYGVCPEAWLVTVPAEDLGFGEELTPLARAGLERALTQILKRLHDQPAA